MRTHHAVEIKLPFGLKLESHSYALQPFTHACDCAHAKEPTSRFQPSAIGANRISQLPRIGTVLFGTSEAIRFLKRSKNRSPVFFWAFFERWHRHYYPSPLVASHPWKSKSFSISRTIGPIGVSSFHLSSNTRIKFFRRLFVFHMHKMWECDASIN